MYKRQPVIYTVVAIAALVAFEILSSVIAMKSSLFRSFLSGDYSIIIDNGVINQKEMTNSQLTMDELMEELRQHGAIHVEDVRYCILETSGKMSILLKKNIEDSKLPVPLIVDGKLVKKNMSRLNMKKNQVLELISSKGLKNISDVFWMVVNDNDILIVEKTK